MSHRRELALAAGALLTLATLSSCGFDYPTDRVNTNAAGVTNRDGDVDVVGAVVVAGQADSGTLIATLSNNIDDELSLEQVVGDGVDAGAEQFEPVAVSPEGYVNLAEAAEAGTGLRISGSFEPGDFIPLVFGFSDGEEVTLEVPVVLPCFQYEGLDSQEPAESESPEGEPLSPDPGGPELTPAAETETAASGEEESSERYSCEIEHGEEH